MNIKVIAFISAVILIAGGVVFALSGSDDSASKDVVAQTEQQEETGADSNTLGVDVAALDGAYKLNITSDEGGEDLEGTFLFDGDGNFSTELTSDGETSSFIFLDGDTYLRSPTDGTWTRFASGSPAAPAFDVSEFALSNDDINDFNSDSSLERLDDQECIAGTCSAWRGVDSATDEEVVVRIDKATNRVSEVELTNSATAATTLITYDYPESISITAPDDFTDVSNPTQ